MAIHIISRTGEKCKSLYCFYGTKREVLPQKIEVAPLSTVILVTFDKLVVGVGVRRTIVILTRLASVIVAIVAIQFSNAHVSFARLTDHPGGSVLLCQ